MHHRIGVGASRPASAALAWFAALLIGGAAQAVTVDFEDVGAGLGPDSFVNDSRGFASGPAGFSNTFARVGDPPFQFEVWDGFSFSNVRDTTTPGFDNQYAAFAPGCESAGCGFGGSDTYAIAFTATSDFPNDPSTASVVSFSTAAVVSGAYVTNTTYAGLSMTFGDGFAKQFGGPDGTDPDFLLLTARGFDASDALTGSAAFYLADFRSDDPTRDFVVDDWSWFDLSSLGTVDRVAFYLSSSDIGPFGMNTPAYFALDDLSATPVPEPGSVLLYALGLGGLALRPRRRPRA